MSGRHIPFTCGSECTRVRGSGSGNLISTGENQVHPLSVLIFNTVINTLVDNIIKSHAELGYSERVPSYKTNLLQENGKFIINYVIQKDY